MSDIRWLSQPRMMRGVDFPMSSFWLVAWSCALSFAWLLPNHFLPWTAFHSDAWCAVVLLIAAASLIIRSKSNTQWHGSTILVALLVCVPALQHITGLISFAGQAWISTAYLLGFLLALLIGQRWERLGSGQLANGLFLAIGVASVLSVTIQLLTWLGLIETGVADLWSMGLVGGRPYANFGQPNQLATLLLWGLLACTWAYVTEKIRAPVAMVLACFLLSGIALSQSRTAWIGLTFLVIAFWAWRGLWRSKWVLLSATALFVFFWAYQPLLRALAEALQIASQETNFRGDQLEGGLRPLAWRLFIDAALRQPWFGYGWSEVSHAQLAVADAFPTLHGTFGQAHNLFLDLVLWLGLPMGLFVSAAIVWQFAAYMRAVSNARDAILVMFLGVVGIHAMLELPLHYAYFLLPTGLVMGILNSRVGGAPVWTTPRWTLVGLWFAATILLPIIVLDYFRIETSFQAARFELAHIGNSPQGKPPEVVLLTQLRERIGLIRYEVKRDMAPEEISWLLQVVNAYPGSGFIYKAARALALNDRPLEAQQWLKKICKVSSIDQCELIKRLWAQDALSSPLVAAVPWPN